MSPPAEGRGSRHGRHRESDCLYAGHVTPAGGRESACRVHHEGTATVLHNVEVRGFVSPSLLMEIDATAVRGSQ